MTKINLKRAYEPETPEDGFRIYIDRLWPQGLSHETFHYDLWEKEISPSTELREWFHQDPEGRWNAFEQKYKVELKHNPHFPPFQDLVESKSIVTLLYSSKNTEHNNAVVIYEVLTGKNE